MLQKNKNPIEKVVCEEFQYKQTETNTEILSLLTILVKVHYTFSLVWPLLNLL